MNNLKTNIKGSVRYSAEKSGAIQRIDRSAAPCINFIWFAIVAVIDNFDHLNQYPCFYKLNKQSVLKSLK
jgi:hypothetical protein